MGFYCLQYFLSYLAVKRSITTSTLAVIPRQRSCARSRSRPPQGRCIIFSPVVSAFRILVRQVSPRKCTAKSGALFSFEHSVVIRNCFQYAYRIEEVNTIGTVCYYARLQVRIKEHQSVAGIKSDSLQRDVVLLFFFFCIRVLRHDLNSRRRRQSENCHLSTKRENANEYVKCECIVAGHIFRRVEPSLLVKVQCQCAIKKIACLLRHQNVSRQS